MFAPPSTHGRDNTCLLDAIKLREGRARGIVDIDENAPEAGLARRAAVGVVGVRINLGPPNWPRETGLIEKHLARIRRLDARCAEIGWQLDMLSPSRLIVDMSNGFIKQNQ